jgi:plasmid stabilization system protein ParE
VIPESVILSRRSQLQFDLIVDYVSARNPDAGERLIERFASGFQQLANFPLSGARGRTPGTRRLIVAPCVVTYRERGDDVVIIDIRDSRQREAPILDDLP